MLAPGAGKRRRVARIGDLEHSLNECLVREELLVTRDAVARGEHGTEKLLLISQVILSLQLSFAVIPLVLFTSDRRKMGEFVNAPWVKALSWAVAVVIAGLNGIYGDELANRGNGFALSMQIRDQGKPVTMNTAAIAAAFPEAGGRIVVFVHGWCMTEMSWRRPARDGEQSLPYGTRLRDDLGFTPAVSATGSPKASKPAAMRYWAIEHRKPARAS